MESAVIFGTYHVSQDGSSFTYTAPALLPKEVAKKISFSDGTNGEKSKFDELLKAIVAVPKPEKAIAK